MRKLMLDKRFVGLCSTDPWRGCRCQQRVFVIPADARLKVWFQRATVIVRKLVLGAVDLGIMGYDMVAKSGNHDLLVVHKALNFGACHLGFHAQMRGKLADVHTLDLLRSMSCWTETTQLQVVSGQQLA